MDAGGRPKPIPPCSSASNPPAPTATCRLRTASGKEGKSASRAIATLGRLDLLQESGQLERLMRSGVRHCQGFAVLDAHAAGQTQPVAVRRLRPDLVFGRLWQESGIPEALGTLLKGRRFEFNVERAIYLTVLHRLFASGSDRASERWREDYLIPGTEGLDLHHLYRAMAFLGEPLAAEGQSSRGPVRCAKDLLEERLFERRLRPVYRSGVGLFRHHLPLL